jgi:hypothetical protein
MRARPDLGKGEHNCVASPLVCLPNPPQNPSILGQVKELIHVHHGSAGSLRPSLALGGRCIAVSLLRT